MLSLSWQGCLGVPLSMAFSMMMQFTPISTGPPSAAITAPKRIFELFNLTELEDRASVKMIHGKEITEKLDLLYAIGTYAKG